MWSKGGRSCRPTSLAQPSEHFGSSCQSLVAQTLLDPLEDRPQRPSLSLRKPAEPAYAGHFAILFPRRQLPGVHYSLPLGHRETSMEKLRVRQAGGGFQESLHRLPWRQRRRFKHRLQKEKGLRRPVNRSRFCRPVPGEEEAAAWTLANWPARRRRWSAKCGHPGLDLD